MKEQLVSFEVAKLAKELGFDEKCYEMFHSKDSKNYKIHEQSAEHYRYTNCSKFFGGSDVTDYERSKVRIKDILKRPSDYPAKDFLYSRTSQSLLQKWLREKHKVIVNVSPIDGWSCWGYTLLGEDIMKPFRKLDSQYNEYSTYEEALEAGLLEALKILKE